jgi:hypothetical protein
MAGRSRTRLCFPHRGASVSGAVLVLADTLRQSRARCRQRRRTSRRGKSKKNPAAAGVKRQEEQHQFVMALWRVPEPSTEETLSAVPY